MVRDLLLLLAVSIVLSAFIWSIFGNSKTKSGHPRGEASLSLNAAADSFQPRSEFIRICGPNADASVARRPLQRRQASLKSPARTLVRPARSA